MYEEVERMYRYKLGKLSLLIHDGGSFRKFPNREYRGDEPMYYHYLRPMTDLDVGLLVLGSDEDVHSLSCLICNFKNIRRICGIESSSASPKKNELLMREWYDNSTPTKASSNTGSMTPKLIPPGLFIHDFDETMIPSTQLHGVNSCVTNTSDLPRVCSQFGSISQAFKTQEKTMGDVIGDVMRRLSFDITNIDDHLEVVSCDVVHLLVHVMKARVDEHLDNDNAPLENVASIGEDIHNDSDPEDSEYDANSSKNEEAKDYADVMIDEENEIHEAGIEVHLFGFREDGYEMDIDDFDIDSGGKSGCPSGRRSALNKLKKAFMQGANADVGGEINGKDKHNYLQSREIKACTYNFLAKRTLDQIKVNPGIPVKEVQDILQRELEVHISMSKAFRAKEKAYTEIKGDQYLQYDKLKDYVVELQSNNPNTTVKLAVERNSDESLPTRIFKRIYVCLGSLKQGFKPDKREILGLDGAFMKGPYPG
ncbi:hypothetical protein Tco_1093262 [Tanacetum coccineum]|uniref:Uncharacterized protein n=1 Tax=Tanacetum coccineum TaxID=301880 RepID=A0ABQ5IDG8_9ASTR